MRKRRETRPVKRRATTNNPGAFQLPPGVSYVKERLAYGWAYVFRHRELGQLGRIVLQGREDGRCHVTCEVVGDPDDPMTAQRMAILQPLTTDLMRRLAVQTGSTDVGLGVDPPPRPPEPKELIKSKLMQCERCDAGVALLIFADRATPIMAGLKITPARCIPRWCS